MEYPFGNSGHCPNYVPISLLPTARLFAGGSLDTVQTTCSSSENTSVTNIVLATKHKLLVSCYEVKYFIPARTSATIHTMAGYKPSLGYSTLKRIGFSCF